MRYCCCADSGAIVLDRALLVLMLTIYVGKCVLPLLILVKFGTRKVLLLSILTPTSSHAGVTDGGECCYVIVFCSTHVCRNLEYY